MQWRNKGHEFDLFWEEIKDIQEIFLFGAGLIGQSVFKFLYTWFFG